METRMMFRVAKVQRIWGLLDWDIGGCRNFDVGRW